MRVLITFLISFILLMHSFLEFNLVYYIFSLFMECLIQFTVAEFCSILFYIYYTFNDLRKDQYFTSAGTLFVDLPFLVVADAARYRDEVQ